MDADEREEVYQTFGERVNMAPKELEDWLQTDESQSVGDSDDSGESTGHASGRRIVAIKRTHKADLSDDDYAHMRKVNGYIARHCAQRPSGDIADTRWRYSLMNWGHDPLKD
ncbi:DUF3140 domain-containing protein [Erythrobacter sp.]|uniref:DUF3140 domain-containing protein n=1 Tax=Erythrobacter sp. TaxID=1042 RepID=UPI0025F59D99|nr:DUF3140 domain-containing protein [Erythrobacter sp.]